MPTNGSVGGRVGSVAVSQGGPTPIDPVPLTLSNDTISEGAANGGLVGHILGISPGSTISLAVSAGGKFAISGTDIVKNAALDYETATSHNITIQEDNPRFAAGLSQTALTVHVSNVLEITEVDLTLSANTISEGAANGGLVGHILGLASGSTISLVNSAGGKFAISGTDIVKNGALDYETATSHNITIQEDNGDATNSGHQTVLTINVVNVLEVTEVNLTLSANTVAEDAANGTIVGAIQGISAGSTISLADSAGGKFAISGTNIVTNAALDYETATSHNITIQENNSDATNSGHQTVLTINVTDVVEQDPHRYWRIRVTAAMNAGALAAFSEVVMAERIGGAHALGAVVPVASATNSGVVANSTDGNVNNIWVGQTMPITLTWDLGATAGNWKDIRSCRINVDPAWHPQGPKTFSIQYSDNNVAWTDRITVASEVGWDGSTTLGWRARIFSAAAQPLTAQAGYLWYRLNITVGVDSTQCAIGEAELRATVGGADETNPNIAVFWSQAAQAWKNTIDNSNGGGWFGTTGFPYLVGWELPKRITLAQLSLIPYPSFPAYAPKNFTIQGSNDFAQWDTVATIINQTAWADSPTARLFNV